MARPRGTAAVGVGPAPSLWLWTSLSTRTVNSFIIDIIGSESWGAVGRTLVASATGGVPSASASTAVSAAALIAVLKMPTRGVNWCVVMSPLSIAYR